MGSVFVSAQLNAVLPGGPSGYEQRILPPPQGALPCTHVPPAQSSPAAHGCEQLPQLSPLLFKSTQTDEQAERPGRHAHDEPLQN